MEAANLPTFVNSRNTKKSNICVIVAKKIMSGHEIGGLKQNWGRIPVPPGLGLKPPLATVHP